MIVSREFAHDRLPGNGRCRFLILNGRPNLLARTLTRSEGGGVALEDLSSRTNALVAERPGRGSRWWAPDAIRQGGDFLMLLKSNCAQVKLEFFDTAQVRMDGR